MAPFYIHPWLEAPTCITEPPLPHVQYWHVGCCWQLRWHATRDGWGFSAPVCALLPKYAVLSSKHLHSGGTPWYPGGHSGGGVVVLGSKMRGVSMTNRHKKEALWWIWNWGCSFFKLYGKSSLNQPYSGQETVKIALTYGFLFIEKSKCQNFT